MKMDISSGLGISLGGLEIASDYLNNPEAFEQDLSEVVDEQKETKKKRDKSIVKPSMNRQEKKRSRADIINKFSLAGVNKDEAVSNEDNNIILDDSTLVTSDNDFDFSFSNIPENDDSNSSISNSQSDVDDTKDTESDSIDYLDENNADDEDGVEDEDDAFEFSDEELESILQDSEDDEEDEEDVEITVVGDEDSGADPDEAAALLRAQLSSMGFANGLSGNDNEGNGTDNDGEDEDGEDGEDAFDYYEEEDVDEPEYDLDLTSDEEDDDDAIDDDDEDNEDDDEEEDDDYLDDILDALDDDSEDDGDDEDSEEDSEDEEDDNSDEEDDNSEVDAVDDDDILDNDDEEDENDDNADDYLDDILDAMDDDSEDEDDDEDSEDDSNDEEDDNSEDDDSDEDNEDDDEDSEDDYLDDILDAMDDDSEDDADSEDNDSSEEDGNEDIGNDSLGTVDDSSEDDNNEDSNDDVIDNNNEDDEKHSTEETNNERARLTTMFDEEDSPIDDYTMHRNMHDEPEYRRFDHELEREARVRSRRSDPHMDAIREQVRRQKEQALERERELEHEHELEREHALESEKEKEESVADAVVDHDNQSDIEVNASNDTLDLSRSKFTDVSEKSEKLDITSSDNKKAKEVVKQTSKPKKTREEKIAIYSNMTVEKLFSHVQKFMKAAGVDKHMISITELNSRFGEANIRKLIKKSYIIQLGKEVTIGR